MLPRHSKHTLDVIAVEDIFRIVLRMLGLDLLQVFNEF
jgi:hypothetical protein